MSRPVDVLAVMDLARESLRNSSQQTREGLALHSAVAQARAAVAHLIVALDVAAYGEYLPETVEQDIRAALALVQGGEA